MRNKYLYIGLLLLSTTFVWGQDKSSRQNSIDSKKEAVKSLSKSLEANKSDKEVANDYMVLARELYAQKEYSRAESNLQQAITLFGKSKERELQATAYRELGRAQEMQGKYDAAIDSYTRASKSSTKKEFSVINQNDVNRLKNRSNPEAQSRYIQKNIDISNTIQNKDEAAVAHQQMAQVKIEMDDKIGAVEELESALENVQDNSSEAKKIRQEIVKTYVADEQYEKAIDLNESLIIESREDSDPKAEVKELKSLAHTYFAAKDETKGLETLQEAYNTAIENNQTMEARSMLRELVNYYKENNDQTSILNLYGDFIFKLDTLIKSDSTLIDEKYFQLHEERIKRLENERALKDELIARTSMFNYVLLGAIVLILIFLGFIAKALFAINKKNKKIALQSLRREMNPHFIFNSLNSVNQFIAQNNELEANKYLSSYSRLMRNIMENSNKDFITLTTEMVQLKEYLELEHMRFRDKFRYEIHVNEQIDTDATYIPNMIIQPQLENAVWHGLRYKEEGGLLTLRIEQQDNAVRVLIEDNGIGLKRSQELKTKHQKQHNSRGLNNTTERIHLLNELYHIPISMEITEKEGEQHSGVIVLIKFPLIDKKP